MSVSDVESAVRGVLQTEEVAGDAARGNEIATRYAFVDPVLRSLGWSIGLPWECRPKFGLGQGRPVDYALFDRDGYPVILIEVEMAPVRRRSHRYNLWSRVRRRREGLAVLAYGLEWEIYDLRIPTRGLDGKRVAWLDLHREAASDLRVASSRLHHWLAKEHWW